MPILHIHSPERLPEFSSIEEGFHGGLLLHARELYARDAQLTILEPEYEGDITPKTFETKDGCLPEASIGIAIDKTGDHAVLTYATGSMGGLAVKKSLTTIGPRQTSNEFRIPEDGMYAPFVRGGLTPLGIKRVQLGGLILGASPEQLNDLAMMLIDGR